MAKNDNAQSVRLVDSLERHVGYDTAREFEANYPLSKSADINKCRCNDGKSIANKLLKYLNKADSIKEFVRLFNEKETFACLEYISDNKIRFCYPECYCACVKRVPQELSKTWCYCTLGNAEGIFSNVFKTDVKVTLLESIKTGADKCVIEVEW